MAKLEPLRSGYYVWHYVPSIAASVIFILLFLGVTSIHVWKLFTTKIRFTLPFAIGGLFEFIGYAARTAAHDKTGRLMPYIIQSVFVLVAPTLFAAAVYMVLARIIRSVNGDAYSPIPMKWITRLFVTCDILTFFIQGGGGGMMAKSNFTKIGQNIVLAGLVLQVVTFFVFLVTAMIFHRRMVRCPTVTISQGDVPWKTHLFSLYTISAMILIRSIFRIIEYGLGNDGYLMEHEWPNYIFDAVPMFIAMVCFAVWYPSELSPFLTASHVQEVDVTEPKV